LLVETPRKAMVEEASAETPRIPPVRLVKSISNPLKLTPFGPNAVLPVRYVRTIVEFVISIENVWLTGIVSLGNSTAPETVADPNEVMMEPDGKS
jgi:hypothetical protein